MSNFAEIRLRGGFEDGLADVDDFNNLRVAQANSLVGSTFIGTTKDTNFYAESVTGSGAVSQGSGAVVLATGVTANSTVQYQTLRRARFIPAQCNRFRFVGKVGDTGTANNVRRWGCYDANNGAFFELDGTDLYVVTRKSGVDTRVIQADWNYEGQPVVPFTLDTNIHAYDIDMNYVDICFFIDNIQVHEIDAIGVLSVVPFDSLENPATLQNVNSGGGSSNVSLTAYVCTVYRIGPIFQQPKSMHVDSATTTIMKYGSGMLHRICVNDPAGSITVYDNTAASGTILAILQGGTEAKSVEYGIPFSTGLTVVTSAGAVDITVVYE